MWHAETLGNVSTQERKCPQLQHRIKGVTVKENKDAIAFFLLFEAVTHEEMIMNLFTCQDPVRKVS